MRAIIDWNEALRSGLLGMAVVAVELVGLYLEQPQRVDFCPKPAPDPNPPIDLESQHPFSGGPQVAVFGFRPDDPESNIGGLLTELSRSRAKVAITMCTNGDKGFYPSFLADAAENRQVR